MRPWIRSRFTMLKRLRRLRLHCGAGDRGSFMIEINGECDNAGAELRLRKYARGAISRRTIGRNYFSCFSPGLIALLSARYRALQFYRIKNTAGRLRHRISVLQEFAVSRVLLALVSRRETTRDPPLRWTRDNTRRKVDLLSMKPRGETARDSACYSATSREKELARARTPVSCSRYIISTAIPCV